MSNSYRAVKKARRQAAEQNIVKAVPVPKTKKEVIKPRRKPIKNPSAE